jgi:hypothetical protein
MNSTRFYAQVAGECRDVWQNGRYKRVETPFKNIVQTRKNALGEEHLDTLNSMECFASTFGSHGRRKEAVELRCD